MYIHIIQFVEQKSFIRTKKKYHSLLRMILFGLQNTYSKLFSFWNFF